MRMLYITLLETEQLLSSNIQCPFSQVQNILPGVHQCGFEQIIWRPWTDNCYGVPDCRSNFSSFITEFVRYLSIFNTTGKTQKMSHFPPLKFHKFISVSYLLPRSFFFFFGFSFLLFFMFVSWDGQICQYVSDGLRAGRPDFSSWHGPDRFGGSPNLLSNRYRWLFPRL